MIWDCDLIDESGRCGLRRHRSAGLSGSAEPVCIVVAGVRSTESIIPFPSSNRTGRFALGHGLDVKRFPVSLRAWHLWLSMIRLIRKERMFFGVIDRTGLHHRGQWNRRPAQRYDRPEGSERNAPPDEGSGAFHSRTQGQLYSRRSRREDGGQPSRGRGRLARTLRTNGVPRRARNLSMLLSSSGIMCSTLGCCAMRSESDCGNS